MNVQIKNMFSGVEDPRIERTKKHPLESILYIALCATIAGIDTWTGFEDYAEEHEDILKMFIDLPNGTPSHDTFARVISALNVENFLRCFESFIGDLTARVRGVISIDGKTLRSSFNKAKNINASHIVSAWADGYKLVLGQVKVDDKSNEITAIPKLLDRLDLQGQIITIDAMGCQRAICKQIIDQGGDYVISLKGNQSSLFEDLKPFFDDASGIITCSWEEWDKGHGRIEHRLCKVTDDISWLQKKHNWPGLCSIAAVYSTRQTNKSIQKEIRYYISSLSPDAERIARCARAHWGIENSLHWILDVVLNEDKSRMYNENAPEILAIMRRWGISLINQHKDPKISTKRMIKKMAMSPRNLLTLLLKN